MSPILAFPVLNLDVVLLYALPVAVTLAVAYIIVRVIGSIVGRFEYSKRIRLQAAALFRTLSSAVVYTVALLILLHIFIAPLEVILVVIIAFIALFFIMARDILANIAAYYALAASVPSKKGDFLEVAGVKGRLLRRSLLFTEMHSEEGRTLHIPNVVFLRNLTSVYSGSSLTKLSVAVRIDGGVDATKAEGILYNLVNSYRELTKPPAPAVLITDVRRDYTEFTLNGYVTNPHKVDAVASDLRKRMRDALETAKIKLW